MKYKSSLFSKKGLTTVSYVTNKMVASFTIKMVVRSEAQSAKRSVASKIKIQNILTRSFASRF